MDQKLPLNPLAAFRLSHGARIGRAALTALALLGAGALWADDAGTEARLKNIERQLEALQKENAELKSKLKGDADKDGPVTVKAAGKESKISLGGMIQTQFETGNAPDSRFSNADRFLMRRARLHVAGSFLENFSWKLEAELGNSNLKNNSSYRAQATDAYIAWTKYDYANVKMGQFKTPFGYEQLQSDSTIFFAERSFVSDRFTMGRELGASVSGDFLEKRLGYVVGAFNGPASNNGFNDNEQFTYVGRLTGVPWKGKINNWESQWSVGADAYSSRDTAAGAISIQDFGFTGDTFAGDRQVWSVDTQFKMGPFDVQGEYFRGHFKPTNRTPFARVNADGFQVTAAAFVIPKILQPAIRYESFNPDVNKEGDSTDEWVFGLNYYIKAHDLKLQLDYHLGNMSGQRDNQGRLIARAQLLF